MATGFCSDFPPRFSSLILSAYVDVVLLCLMGYFISPHVFGCLISFLRDGGLLCRSIICHHIGLWCSYSSVFLAEGWQELSLFFIFLFGGARNFLFHGCDAKGKLMLPWNLLVYQHQRWNEESLAKTRGNKKLLPIPAQLGVFLPTEAPMTLLNQQPLEGYIENSLRTAQICHFKILEITSQKLKAFKAFS